jgi:hypothetical protein
VGLRTKMRSRKSDPESTLLEVIQVNFRRHSDARLLTDMLEGKRASDTANVMGSDRVAGSPRTQDSWVFLRS